MRRVGGIVVLVLAGAGLWWLFARTDAQALAERVRALGPIGPLATVALLVLQCVVAPIPSEPIMMSAGFVYGARTAFVLAWLGVVLGAAGCYLLARAFGRPLTERFVARDRLAAIEQGLVSRGAVATFSALLAIRMVAFSSFDVLSYACGLVRIPLGWFLLATVVGAVPKVLAFTYVGAAADRPGWLDAVMIAGTVPFLLLVPWLLARRRG